MVLLFVWRCLCLILRHSTTNDFYYVFTKKNKITRGGTNIWTTVMLQNISACLEQSEQLYSKAKNHKADFRVTLVYSILVLVSPCAFHSVFQSVSVCSQSTLQMLQSSGKSNNCCLVRTLSSLGVASILQSSTAWWPQCLTDLLYQAFSL